MIYFYEDDQRCESFCDGITTHISYNLSICTPDEGVTNAKETGKSTSRAKNVGASVVAI